MRITEITVTFSADSDFEKEVWKDSIRILRRDSNKNWSVNGGGMFPSEMRVASIIQKEVIETFNAGKK